MRIPSHQRCTRPFDVRISAIALGDDEEENPVPPTVDARGVALLIDDEDLVRMSTADMLGDFGYDVVEAGTADEALMLLQGGLTPDLVVIDHLMPGMNGAELARLLKAERPGLSVLIVSGYAEADGIDPAIARLTKPFRISDLAESQTALIQPRGA